MINHTQIPITPDDLTLEWLLGALADSDSSFSPTPTSFASTPIGVGLSASGVLTRLNLSYESDQSDSIKSVIVKMPMHPSNPNGASVRKQGTYPREIRFYDELALECPLVVPAFHYGRHDADSGDAVLVIQDLAGKRPGDNADGCSNDEALKIVSDLGKFQAHFWDADRRDDLQWLSGGGIADLMATMFQSIWADGREGIASSIPEELLSLGDRYFEDSGLLAWIDEPPVTLFHGDFRLDNMYFTEDGFGPITYADFQRVGVGRGATDLAVFALSALNVDQRRAIENDLLDTYHQQLVDGGVDGFSRDEVLFDYRRSIAFVALRSLVAMLAFTNSASSRNDALLRTMTAVEDMKAIDALG